MNPRGDLNAFYTGWKQHRDNWIAEHGNFPGHHNPDRHRTTGTRAWCECGTWCYPDVACSCCREQMADENPCPHCGGTGVATDPEGES